MKWRWEGMVCGGERGVMGGGERGVVCGGERGGMCEVGGYDVWRSEKCGGGRV